MENIKKIAVLDNIVEAQMLESLLKEQNIPYVMTTYHDSAYDGLFQGQMGWGHVEAPEKHESEILAMLDDLKPKNGNENEGNGV